jgi:hypothetical protein
MGAHVALIPGTSIVEYTFANDVDLNQYQDCIAKGKSFLEQLPDGPAYALVDLRNLRTIPYNFLQTTKTIYRRQSRVDGLAVIGANAFLQMMTRMTLRVLRNRGIRLAFCDTREEALLALERMAREEWSESDKVVTCA